MSQIRRLTPPDSAACSPPAHSKDISLEAMRGLAALTVLIGHCMGGFAPQLLKTLMSTPFFFVANGSAAVSFFFVLSGFVLTRTFFITGRWPIIVRGVVKRWPRLAGPVLITTLASCLLWNIGAYHFAQAGAASGSDWLSSFANALTGATPSFGLKAALRQGLVTTFIYGDSWFNTVLWTMKFEFIGSMVAFGLAALIYPMRRHRFVVGYCLALTAVACDLASPQYACFPAGVALALYLPRTPSTIRGWIVALSAILALYLLGFTPGAGGAYAWADTHLPSHARAYLPVAGAILMISIVETSIRSKAILSMRGFALLGEWSFPLYLVHILVLCSVGCLAYLAAPPHWVWVAASLVTAIAAFVAAYPLVLFNRIWVRFLNRLVAAGLEFAADRRARAVAWSAEWALQPLPGRGENSSRGGCPPIL